MDRSRHASQGQPPLGLALFCEQQWPRLVATLAFLVRDVATAEDLAQEALVRLCQHWSRVAGMEYPGVWLHRVAVNLAHTHNRGQLRRSRAGATLVEREPTPPDPTTEMVLRAAVRALPERERVVVILRYFADFSVRDTAAVVRASESTVKLLTHRAVTRLRATTLFNIEEVADA